MKRDRLYTCLTGGLLAFFISLSGVMCIVTGFAMDLRSVTRLAVILALYCALAALIFTKKYGKWWLFGGWILAYLLFRKSDWLLRGVEAVLYRVSLLYDEGYNIGYIQWSKTSPALVAPDLGLCLVAILVATVILWTVCCRKRAFIGVTVGFLPLIACLVVTFTVPAERWLFLLVAAQLLLMLTSSVRRRSAEGGNRLVALLLVPSILAVSLLFWVTPKDSYQPQSNRLEQLMQNWLSELPFITVGPDGALHIGDSYEEGTIVDLSKTGPRARRDIPVMEVYAEESGTLYLRGRQYDTYTGTDWTATGMSDGYENGWPDTSAKDHGLVVIKTRAKQSLMYFPYYTGIAATTRFEDGAMPNNYKEKTYQFYRFSPFYYQPNKLSDHEIRHYTALSKETWNRAQKQLGNIYLASHPTIGVVNVEVLVEAIGDYIRNSAAYDLGTPRMPEGETDFAMWFLEQSDTGYCVHFASAAVVLLRAAGIPARYVSGYVVDAKADQFVTVTAERAHAWVEYYQYGRGWTVLEVTPGMGSAPVDPTEPPPTTEPPVTTEPTEPTQPSKSPTEPSEEPTEPSSGTTEPTGEPQPPNSSKKLDLSWLWKCLVYLTVAAGVCGAVWGQYVLRRNKRHKRMTTGANNARALAMWRESLRFGRILKLPLPEDLLMLAEKAKFSQHTLTDGELAAFAIYLQECNGKLGEKPWIWRGILRLIFAM